MRLILFIILLLNINSALAYKLAIIQGVSKEKQTFVTRNEQDHIFLQGQTVTFTSNNVSVLAKAMKVTREFTQWEILNDFTDVPFRRGEIVTMYQAREYLWALSPETVKRKYVKAKLFKTKKSFETKFAYNKGISESVSLAAPENPDRSGYQFESMFRRQMNFNWAAAFGLRYTQEIINLPAVSLTNTRFTALAEARYYFGKMEDFFDAQIGLALGVGFGQSRTQTTSQTSFGDVLILPTTKISLDFPISNEYEFGIVGAFESLRIEESFTDNNEQTTNLNNTHVGVVFRKHLE